MKRRFFFILFFISIFSSAYADFESDLQKAQRGDVNAQFSVARAYYLGEGITRSRMQAAQWWEKAAKKGEVRSQFNIGLVYFNGVGISKDVEKGIYWLRMAAEQNYVNAQLALADIYYNSEDVPTLYSQAVYWYRRAAKSGNPLAQEKLGNLYILGQGVLKDFEIAMYWLKKAADNGNQDAKTRYAMLSEYGYAPAKTDPYTYLTDMKLTENDNDFDPSRNYQGENALAYLGEILIVNDFPEPIDYTLPWTENKYKIVAYRGFKNKDYDGNDVYTSENNPLKNYQYSRDFEWNVRGTHEKWLKGKAFRVYDMHQIKRYPTCWVFKMYNIDDPEDEVSYVYHGEYHEKKDTRYGDFDLEWLCTDFNYFPFTSLRYLQHSRQK